MVYNRNPDVDPEEPAVNRSDLEALEYKTCDQPGYAVVINNRAFNGRGLHDRSGTDRDASNLINRFDEFGYHTVHLVDMSKEELMAELRRIASLDHKDHSAFFCAILTHGNKDGLWATDSQMKLTDLTDIFDAENCQTLLNKPKVFIVQACRGDEEGKPVVIRVLNEDRVVADALPNEPVDMEIPEEPVEPTSVDILTIPANMDFLFIHATVEGKKAWRNTASGTPFIGKFCDELQTLLNGQGQVDIYTLLNCVNREVALKFQAQEGGKQMPCFVSTLTKTFKLKVPQ
ncbi:caspase-3-like isoform X4 [Mizuhopecten yessoensis]|nr:caspase-3-like isoform X2 [Mizuhopecten yessoensis]XP_021346541.1 caspase-3-like isoform X3 [Mizuhopecten yessoensis]XP_021346542.1 caspase-3-like isoform X4 [Mizuhopecten yessoensis]